MTKKEFIDAATAAARRSSAQSGWPAGVTVAQAALESDWGRSRLSRDCNNYFGIKAHRAYPSQLYPTNEFRDGEHIITMAAFAKYASIDECFADRDAIIARVALYASARACASDPEKFIAALAKHWATDPKYAEKLLVVYRAHHFDELDRVATPAWAM
jgi:flagellum-specific peptidoglycan hydrolase FlgJ